MESNHITSLPDIDTVEIQLLFDTEDDPTLVEIWVGDKERCE